MQHFLKCLRFQRIYEAAQRHGWYYVDEAALIGRAFVKTREDGTMIAHYDDGAYRIEAYDPPLVTLRKIASWG